MKLFSRINDSTDAVKLQDDLNNLIRWSEEWQMLFNISKCKVMHSGNCILYRHYFMDNQKLEVVHQEKDLGILITDDLKVSQHCQLAYNKLKNSRTY